MRLEISGRTELSLAVIRELRNQESPVKGAALADRLGTTPTYLPHVMRPLVQQGWIESDRGPRGGYRLVGDLDDISLLDLIEVVEGALDDDRCVLGDRPCPPLDRCVLHEPWQRARRALAEELRNTALAEVSKRREVA